VQDHSEEGEKPSVPAPNLLVYQVQQIEVLVAGEVGGAYARLSLPDLSWCLVAAAEDVTEEVIVLVVHVHLNPGKNSIGATVYLKLGQLAEAVPSNGGVASSLQLAVALGGTGEAVLLWTACVLVLNKVLSVDPDVL